MNELEKAVAIVHKYEYEIALLQDLKSICELLPKSAVGVIDPSAESRLTKLHNGIQQYIQQQDNSKLRPESYLFVMLVANSMIQDDHTNIQVHELKDSTLHYGGFLATFEQNKVVIYHSNDPRLPVGEEIAMVNGKAVLKVLDEFNKWASPQTENEQVNYRRASAYLGVLNPFNTIHTVQLKSGKQVKLKYRPAHRALFGRKSLQSVIMKIVYKVDRIHQLGVSALQTAGMLYFDLHTFLPQSKDLQQVAQLTRAVTQKWVNWVVLDLRNNFGGSLLILNQLIKYMYGEQLAKQLHKCTVNRYMTSHEFLKQYYTDFVLPVIEDPKQTSHLKKLYTAIYNTLKSSSDKGEFCDNKINAALCNKDLLSAVQKKVAKDFLSSRCNKRIVVLTDSHCYSACVWTSKFLVSMPNCVLIGQGVSDTKFSGNALTFELPSGKASLQIPQVLSELHNRKMKQVIQGKLEPDFTMSDDQMNDRVGLVVTLIKNYQDLDQKIEDKCKQTLRTQK